MFPQACLGVGAGGPGCSGHPGPPVGRPLLLPGAGGQEERRPGEEGSGGEPGNWSSLPGRVSHVVTRP